MVRRGLNLATVVSRQQVRGKKRLLPIISEKWLWPAIPVVGLLLYNMWFIRPSEILEDYRSEIEKISNLKNKKFD
uniref:Uncharacterized protein n=1 Tax=Tetranychus urticae TaxID=32264 RepID=T1JTM6_TETUR